jgi:glycosyltransferase XagB
MELRVFAGGVAASPISDGLIKHLRARQRLPLVPLETVKDLLGRLQPHELDLVLKHKLVPVAILPNRVLYAAAADCAYQKALDDQLTIVGRVEPHDYRRAVRDILGPRLIEDACHRLHRHLPLLSNKVGAPLWQRLLLGIGVVLLVMPSLLFSAAAFSWFMAFAAGGFFLLVVSLRLMCLVPAQVGRTNMPRTLLADEDLPVYTVLVPLFRETGVLGQLVSSLIEIDYPRRKLDIKLLLEETDVAMHRAIADLKLSALFDIVVVPVGTPQTKPRALNYGLRFARGSLVTIFDAEDIPHPAQLRIAAETFACAPAAVGCLQAELAFFNASENWLSGQFAAEYASLFRVMLPRLAAEGLPMPLGGTSNHFRRDVLERVGAWDPYNVTEDADLGTRLVRCGYRSGVIASHTLEEANIHVLSWIKQRSRWLKGFLLTWLVHMRNPAAAYRTLGPAGMWAFTAMTLGVFLSALLHPLYTMRLIIDLVFADPPQDGSGLDDVILGLAVVLTLVSYATSFLIGLRGLEGRFFPGWRRILFTMPLYWWLLMPAAMMALYESYASPFTWRKTAHGKTRLGQHIDV